MSSIPNEILSSRRSQVELIGNENNEL